MSNGRRSTYSPIQRFRRASQDEDAKIFKTFKVTSQKVPNFYQARNSVYPIIKPWNWIKRARDSLQAETKSSLICKQIQNLPIGVLYALYNEEKGILRYVSSVDLAAWQLNEKELMKYAKENLIKKVGLIEKNEPLFTETQTGVFYCNKLNHLTSSLLAVPDVFHMIPLKSNNYVVLCPQSDVIYVSHCQDQRGLCIIGELSLRCARSNTLLTAKPMRITKNGLNLYEASIVRNEASVPCSEDQLKTCKKAVFKKSRKF